MLIDARRMKDLFYKIEVSFVDGHLHLVDRVDYLASATFAAPRSPGLVEGQLPDANPLRHH
jgi:hypothetical protein